MKIKATLVTVGALTASLLAPFETSRPAPVAGTAAASADAIELFQTQAATDSKGKRYVRPGQSVRVPSNGDPIVLSDRTSYFARLFPSGMPQGTSWTARLWVGFGEQKVTLGETKFVAGSHAVPVYVSIFPSQAPVRNTKGSLYFELQDSSGKTQFQRWRRVQVVH